MKKALFQICSVIVLTIIGAAVSAQAQTQQYRANIPFDFNVGQKTYKAGEYFVGLLSQVSDSKIIVIRDAKGRNSFSIIPTVSDSKPQTATLIFNRYADQYYLTEIDAPTFKAKLSKSRHEERLANGEKSSKERVALAKKD